MLRLNRTTQKSTLIKLSPHCSTLTIGCELVGPLDQAFLLLCDSVYQPFQPHIVCLPCRETSSHISKLLHNPVLLLQNSKHKFKCKFSYSRKNLLWTRTSWSRTTVYCKHSFPMSFLAFHAYNLWINTFSPRIALLTTIQISDNFKSILVMNIFEFIFSSSLLKLLKIYNQHSRCKSFNKRPALLAFTIKTWILQLDNLSEHRVLFSSFSPLFIFMGLNSVF